MITNPAGMLYRKMEASLEEPTTDKKPEGFFARGGLQQGSSVEPKEIVSLYFKHFRKAREEFNNG
tara:strand:- start:6349 stop:6543 length:195 start_codon:yes stop_codon:yes gene_type:complete